MMNAAQATALSDEVLAGTSPATVYSTASEGNEFLDEINLAVTFAAKKGLKTTYLNVLKYPIATVKNGSTTLEGMGFTVNDERLRYYKEIEVSWP